VNIGYHCHYHELLETMVVVMHAAWRAMLSITLGVLNAQDANLVRNSIPEKVGEEEIQAEAR